MKARTVALVLAGAVALGAPALSTDAAEINGTGASAGTPFSSFVPLLMCDASPTPIHYTNGLWGGFAAGAQHVWVCNRGGASTIFRYHGTNSSAGLNKVKPNFGSGGDNQVQLDINALSNCVGPNTVTISGHTFSEFTGCTNSSAVNFPTHYGFSDVRGSSFHQAGPPGSFINPIDEGSLVRATAAIVPFDIVLGTGVVATSGGTVAGPVASLSRTQAEAIFSRATVTDWRQLGLATCTGAGFVNGEMCAPGTAVDATSPMDLCLRNSGSGTKASIDEEVLKDATETAIGITMPNTSSAHGVYFNGSNGNVRDCIKGATGFSLAHPTAVGYMEADQAAIAALTGPGGRPQNLYVVRLGGARANDVTKAEPRADIICGRHLYWSNENMWKRPAPAAGIDATTQQLIDDYFTTASATATVAALPAGAFWVDEATMNVSKNADAGPILWKALPLPSPNACQ